MCIADDRIVVTGRNAAGRILSSPTKRRDFEYLVSIGGFSELPPPGFRNVPRRLRLVFEDELTQQLGGPSRGDVEALVNFGRAVDFSKGRMLIHCQAGVSRSAAAAVIVLMANVVSARPEDVSRHVHRLNPQCRPNTLMLKLADDVLSTDGALLKAWSEILMPATSR